MARERKSSGESSADAVSAAPAWWCRLAWDPWDIALEPVRRQHGPSVRRALTGEIAGWLGIGTVEEMRSGVLVWASEAEGLARSGTAFRYLIQREGKFVGAIEVRPDAVRGHIGYWLRRRARGRGSVTFANRLVIPIAFEGFGLKVVDWTAHAANAASIEVMRQTRWPTGRRVSGDQRLRSRLGGSVSAPAPIVRP